MSEVEIEIDEEEIARLLLARGTACVCMIPAGATIGKPFRRDGKLIIPYTFPDSVGVTITVGVES